VFQLPHPTKWHVYLQAPSVEGIEQVQTADMLGVIFQCYFTSHVDAVLTLCSQIDIYRKFHGDRPR